MRDIMITVMVLVMALTAVPACSFADDMFAVDTDDEQEMELDPDRGVGEWDDDTGTWINPAGGVGGDAPPLFQSKDESGPRRVRERTREQAGK